MFYDDETSDSLGFPQVGEINIAKGVANVITGQSDLGASFDIDILSNISQAADYWSLTGLAAPSTPGDPPYENVLDQFASYAPLWTLACLTPDQYNNPSLYRGNPAALRNVIFSSAGRFDGQRTQTIVGAPEYFVNNFTMEMTTTPTEKVGVSNLIKMNFEVYEPYSMTYFIQSLQTAAIDAGYPSYNGAPFLLMLEFVGHRDNGQMFQSSEMLKKYFAIKITKCTFTTNESGTVYKVEAVPFPHIGFTNVAQQVMRDVKIRGENLKELLVAGELSLCNTLNRMQDEMVDKGKYEYPDRYIVVFPVNWSDKVGLPGEAEIPEEEYGEAAFDPDEPFSSPVVGRKGQETLNFGLGEIGNSSLGFGATSGGNFAFGFENDVTDESTGLITRGQLKIDPKLREFQFTKNSNIQNIIQQCVLSSEYAKNALDPSKLDRDTGRIKWFRVDVQVEIGAFDTKRNERQKTFIFRVLPFYVHASVFRNPGTNPPGYPKLNELCAKEYQYIYTGKNHNVIKFDIQINQLFNSGMNPTPLENTESETNPGSQQVGEDPGQRDFTPPNGEVLNMTTPDSGPQLPDPEMTKKTTKGGYGAETVPQKVAQMLMNKILKQGSTGDLIKVNLEIIGDPYWIADSGIGNYIGDFYGNEGGRNQGPYAMIDGNGSLNYQGADTYIRIIFATPVEPLLGTQGVGGLYSFPKGKVNPYSGLYKVIKCINKFSDGKFTQTLECSRMPNQPQDFEGGYEVDTKFFPNDISIEDTPALSPNDDTAEFLPIEYQDWDLNDVGTGPSDEEIAANNEDLGDFPG